MLDKEMIAQCRWKVGDRVEIPYNNPYWQAFKEGVVAEVHVMPSLSSDQRFVVINVQEVHRDHWEMCDPDGLKVWSV